VHAPLSRQRQPAACSVAQLAPMPHARPSASAAVAQPQLQRPSSQSVQAESAVAAYRKQEELARKSAVTRRRAASLPSGEDRGRRPAAIRCRGAASAGEGCRRRQTPGSEQQAEARRRCPYAAADRHSSRRHHHYRFRPRQSNQYGYVCETMEAPTSPIPSRAL